MSAHTRGAALVHALVIVAALSALAVGLLARAEGARLRIAHLRQSDQADLYLDAVARLAVLVLDQDFKDSATDHTGEFWAGRDHSVPIDLGRAEGRITDLQGRFNVNWLGAGGDAGTAARAAFERLARAQGLAPWLVARLIDGLDPGNPQQAMAMVRGAGGSKPRPGPVLTIAELRLIEGMTDADLARLAPLLAALPGQTPINANTVLPEVLAAFLPDVPVQVVRDALASRDQTPYESTADFQTRMARRLSERAQAALPMGRITVASDWFEARIAAQLDMVDRRRTLILRRNPVDGATEIVLTLPAPEPD